MHKARKRFGQNFLRDQGIIDRIIRSISPQQDDRLIEIGPGQGAITAPLIKACEHLEVIEIDKDLIPILLAQFANYPAFKIHQEDVLKFDFKQLVSDKAMRIVGNLPYNISSPLIFRLLNFAEHIQDMHFMLQKEVVQRMAAPPGDKHFGRLTVMVQYYCEVEHIFNVPPEAFTPRPKVDSAIVRLKPHTSLPFTASNLEHFANLVNIVFQQRRKTLRNTLKTIATQEQLENLSIDLSLRPEQLSLEDFVMISNQLVSSP